MIQNSGNHIGKIQLILLVVFQLNFLGVSQVPSSLIYITRFYLFHLLSLYRFKFFHFYYVHAFFLHLVNDLLQCFSLSMNTMSYSYNWMCILLIDRGNRDEGMVLCRVTLLLINILLFSAAVCVEH